MATNTFQSLPGFRDFLPRDCAVRNYLFEKWRGVARKYGFVEYETPLVEATELYLKKTGGELPTQLFRFKDQGDRDITLRPEVTASLARIVAANQRNFPKPLKWFEIGQCFRYEKPQKGRGREFFQFNVDIIGEAGISADVELISLAIDSMRAFGFGKGDFVVRISDREAWVNFASQYNIHGEQLSAFLQIIDKLERSKPEDSDQKLQALGLTLAQVKTFMSDAMNASEKFTTLLDQLKARGLDTFVELDLSIVRGLAYYTGIVFEIFDSSKAMRAVAGGGRYDDLIKGLSDNAVDLPATGFAMGDYVIKNLIEETPKACIEMEAWIDANAPADVFIVVADDSKQNEALALLQQLRDANVRTDFSMAGGKFNKQFKSAEQSGARFVAVLGAEYPELKIKILSSRTEETIPADSDKVTYIKERLTQADGPLLA